LNGRDPEEIVSYLPYLKDMEVSDQSLGDYLTTLSLLVRQSSGGVAVGNAVLPIGAIIGIAIFGSAVIFGVMTVTIMHYLRSKYRLKNGSRNLDLSDDNEEDMVDTLISTRPSERELVTKIPHRPLKVRSESLPKDSMDIPSKFLPLGNSKLIPPACAFEIIGLRDSWPLVGWAESAYTSPMSANKHLVFNSGIINRRTSYSAFPIWTDNEPSWPQPTLPRSCSYNRGLDGRSIQWSGHSAKSSITSLERLSSTRKSTSDNQLTSILRSTSQRLKEQRRPLSRSLSVMSHVSGAPPTMQPPPPPGDQRGESREALINADDMSLVDSVRSSVLNSVSQTFSPQKIASHTGENIIENEKIASPATSEKSEPDSLCPSKTPDLFIPAALTLPSKQEGRANQKHAITISSTAGHSNKMHPRRKEFLPAGDGNGPIHSNHSSDHIGSTSDPFVSANPRLESALKSKAIMGPRPLIKRQVTLDQNMDLKDRETAICSLRNISGNQQSPTKSALATVDPSAVTQENPFQWSPRCSPSLVLSPSQKPSGIKLKGHRRRRTVRLSHVTRPTSVAVVLEESESGAIPSQVQDSIRTQTWQPHSPTKTENAPRYPDQSKTLSRRPPSVSRFEPFLAVPTESKISSDEPYSATISFYDFNSSGGACSADNSTGPEPGHSPTPPAKKSRRRGCNFFVDATRATDIALLETTKSSLKNSIPLSPPKPVGAQFLNFKDAKTLPTFTSHLYTPTSPQNPTVSNSITSSVSLLRRMNSEVSTYSTGSFLSDYSNGSPTFPELRGDGISPPKRGSEGTMNYLNVGVKAPSPTGRRGRSRASASTDKSRDYHQSLALEDNVENYDALGLVMSFPKGSLPKLPSMGSLRNVSVQGNWPPAPTDWPSTSPNWPAPPRQTEHPTAQLRPMNSTLLTQENYHSCNKPLSPLRLNPRDSRIAACYHDHCFKCGTCNAPLGTAFTIEEKPYCKQHYHEKVNEICNVIDSPSKRMEQDRSDDDRWSEIMMTPLKKSVRHESQLEMPAPHDGSPKSMIQWRGSLGLYDEMGFLKSSPDRGQDVDSFGSGAANDLVMGT
jgi:hypothetical protein